MDLSVLKQLVSFVVRHIKSPIFWARIFGYALPAAFLVYVYYVNFIPSAPTKDLVIDVGTISDTKVSEFYIEPSRALSERQIDEVNEPYREVYGMVKAIFKPDNSLKNAHINATVEGKNISFIQKRINFDPASVSWDYEWNFQQLVPKQFTTTTAFILDGSVYLDGSSRLEFPNSSNLFEESAFTVFAKWNPSDSKNDFQQIVGHYNWEVLQDKTRIRFMVGRMEDKDGPFSTVEYSITEPQRFFGETHSLLAIYSPNKTDELGYIELYVDGEFAGRSYFGAYSIWKDYNGNKNLTLGKSDHGAGTYYKGSIEAVNIANRALSFSTQNTTEITGFYGTLLELPIISTTTGILKQVRMYVHHEP